MREDWNDAHAYFVLSPELGLFVQAPRWETQARTFFGVELKIQGNSVAVGADADTVHLDAWPAESCVQVLQIAREAAATMGGFDALVSRTRTVIGVRPSASLGHSLLVAAICASIVLGPILTPDGALLGVKSARERLRHLLQT